MQDLTGCDYFDKDKTLVRDSHKWLGCAVRAKTHSHTTIQSWNQQQSESLEKWNKLKYWQTKLELYLKEKKRGQ